jgi:hypothetical protein
LIAVAAALALASCATVDDPSTEVSTPADNSAKSYRQWEESTRDFADDLMAEAQRAHSAGYVAEAAALADDALCIVLETPEGYPADNRYLTYLAELIDEASEIDAALFPIEEDIDDTEEFALLPPSAGQRLPTHTQLDRRTVSRGHGVVRGVSPAHRNRPFARRHLPADDPRTVCQGGPPAGPFVPATDRIGVFGQGVLARTGPRNVAVHRVHRSPLWARYRVADR